MLRIDFLPFPELQTERLLLRRPEASDVEEMFLYRSDKGLMRYIPHRLAASKEQVVSALQMINANIDKGESINWAITQKGDPRIMGMLGYVKLMKDHHRAEIGYMLHTPFHGTGVIQEAVRCVIDYGFEVMKLHSMEAIVNSQNIPSQKLLERNGFTRDAFFRDYLFHDGSYMDAYVYSLIAPEA